MSGKRKVGGEGTLDGMCFAITGSLSVVRSEFENLIRENGGSVAKTVTNSCTHLVSSETGTKKCQDAEAKGIEIVDEDWVRATINGNSEGEEEKTSKKTKSSKPSADSDGEDDNDNEEGEESKAEENRLSDILLLGTLSVSRAEFEKFIKENGGTIAKSITKSCTHLVTSETGTKKCQEAEDKGIEIVDEDWVRSRVNGDGDDDGDGSGGEDDGGTDDEDEEGTPGDGIDITGTIIEIGEPPYKRSFLKKICDRGPQYTTLSAGGDFEAWLEDLEIIIPFMPNLEIVNLNIPQSGLDGLIDIIGLVNNCQHLRECDLNGSFERESMEIIRTLLLSHPLLELLDVTADCNENEENEEIVVKAIKEAFEKYKQDYKLKSFEGFKLSEKKNLLLLGFDEERRGMLEGKRNSDILNELRRLYE